MPSNLLRWTLAMEIDSNTDHPAGRGGASMTSRRSFIVAVSLGAESLYGLWAGLGVAPLRFCKTGYTTAAGSATEGGGQTAWTAPICVLVLVIAMYAATIAAFALLRALPLAATAGLAH